MPKFGAHLTIAEIARERRQELFEGSCATRCDRLPSHRSISFLQIALSISLLAFFQ
jgi:hypothetical protein